MTSRNADINFRTIGTIDDDRKEVNEVQVGEQKNASAIFNASSKALAAAMMTGCSVFRTSVSVLNPSARSCPTAGPAASCSALTSFLSAWNSLAASRRYGGRELIPAPVADIASVICFIAGIDTTARAANTGPAKISAPPRVPAT